MEEASTQKQLDELLNRIQGCRNEMKRVTEEIKARVEWTLSASPVPQMTSEERQEPFGFKDCVNDCLTDMDDYNATLKEMVSRL
jgi:hypothetical protein